MMQFQTNAAAGVNANVRLEASLGVFGNALEAGATAGLSGGARADAAIRCNTYVNYTYDNGTSSINTSPCCGRSKPITRSTRVVFPDPDGPTMVMIRPFGKLSDIFFSTG